MFNSKFKNILRKIKQYNTIVIARHTSPDPDAVASQIALRDANIYSDQKLVEVYKDLSARINGLEEVVNAQAVYNATNTATINCIQGQVAQLFGLTKLVVPNTSVCPGWGNVTITPSTTTTTGA